jgi:hypothetical protein
LNESSLESAFLLIVLRREYVLILLEFDIFDFLVAKIMDLLQIVKKTVNNNVIFKRINFVIKNVSDIICCSTLFYSYVIILNLYIAT